MFLGWYDPDRKKPARAKLSEAIERYVEKFGRRPKFCLTSAQDAAELARPSRRFPGELPVLVQARSYIARFTYYVGESPHPQPLSHCDGRGEPDPRRHGSVAPAEVRQATIIETETVLPHGISQ